MSELSLPRVERVVTQAVETGQIPGAVVTVAVDGQAPAAASRSSCTRRTRGSSRTSRRPW
ncbi:MAG TPA: hypothetical protein VFE26_10130 [Trebonia sp.]|nr:hypothetical protein [Trebonia sp.]